MESLNTYLGSSRFGVRSFAFDIATLRPTAASSHRNRGHDVLAFGYMADLKHWHVPLGNDLHKCGAS